VSNAETTARRSAEAVTGQEIRALVARLGRPHPSGGTVIERPLGGGHRLRRHDGVDPRPRSDRVDDRARAPHQPQRQALAERRHVPALDSRRHARSRAPVPPHHSATPISPNWSPRSSATSISRPPRPRPRRPLRSSSPDHHTGTAVENFHGDRDILRPHPCQIQGISSRVPRAVPSSPGPHHHPRWRSAAARRAGPHHNSTPSAPGRRPSVVAPSPHRVDGGAPPSRV
jgi:hypothetical protein